MIDDVRYKKAIERFDQENSKDPNQETWEGKRYPKELIYAQRMSDALELFEPNASEALYLAARSQHICRWEIPRSSYPMNKKGYHQWRIELRQFHAKKANHILEELSYDQETRDKVAELLQKKNLKKDAETQVLEDVICLVFLEFYYEDFAHKYEEEKLVQILRKTWLKMSEKGRAAALEIELAEFPLSFIKKAISL